MRILQLVQKPQRRGAETFSFELSRWVESHGHETKTAYLYPYNGDKALPLVGEDVVLDGDEASRWERLPGIAPGLLGRVRQVIADYAPDIVQVNGARTIKYGAFAKLTAPTRRWHLVYRNIDSPEFWVKGLQRRLFYSKLVMPRLDGVIGVSVQTLDEVMQFYDLDVPSEFIPNGVDLSKLDDIRDVAAVRAELGTPPGAPVLLFIGQLGQQKRPDRFVRVLQRVRQSVPDVVGWLLGDGPHRATVEQLIAELDLQDCAHLLGYQSDVASYIAAGDVLVMTSETEGIPAVIIEASYAGKPTLAYDVGGLRECVADGHTGYLVAAEDETALVARIEQVLSGDVERQRLGEAARARACEEFSMDTVGSRYVRFYERVRRGER